MTDDYRPGSSTRHDSHIKVLVLLEEVPEPLLESESYQKAPAQKAFTLRALLAAVVRCFWLFRFGPGPQDRVPKTLEGFFPKDVSLPDLPSASDEIEEKDLGGPARQPRQSRLGRHFRVLKLGRPGIPQYVGRLLTQFFGPILVQQRTNRAAPALHQG